MSEKDDAQQERECQVQAQKARELASGRCDLRRKLRSVLSDLESYTLKTEPQSDERHTARMTQTHLVTAIGLLDEV